MKKLVDILYKVKTLSINGSIESFIETICFDSRAIENNALFVAIKGVTADGHNFLANIDSDLVKAVICEKLPMVMNSAITYIVVSDSNEALGIVAANFYDNPSEKLKLIGITGTNGKTTTATLLHELFSKIGYKTGLISTICIKIDQQTYNTTHTTPDALTLNRTLAQMVNLNITHCFMEVSSHAVVQHRISGLYFTGGVFTNISHDHLDYHKSFAAYINAKKSFFDNLPKTAFALSNIDDTNGEVMLQNTQAKKSYFGLRKDASFKCRIIESHFLGMNLQINQNDFWVKLIGKFNAYNILAAFATAQLLGEDISATLSALSNIEPIEGRFQHFTNNNNITAIVDYAHTPDALKNVLETISDIRTGNEKLFVVIGCGGNRDAAKRPLMAKIAALNANHVIITSDNPRFEKAEEIMNDMYGGLDIIDRKKTLMIENRKEAIKTACVMADSKDIILVAGKGHEKYQEIMGVKYPFDDMVLLIELLINN